MNFKILSVFYARWGDFDDDSGEIEPFHTVKKGYYLSEECLEDSRKICIFVPESKVKDMDAIKIRLKSRYNKDITDEINRKQWEAEHKAIVDTLTGVIIDP